MTSYSVTIKTGKTDVALPDGGIYQAGDTVILSEVEYLALSQEALTNWVTDNGVVDGSAGVSQEDFNALAAVVGDETEGLVADVADHEARIVALEGA